MRYTLIRICDVARMGRFSSDRAIQQYADEIWHAGPAFPDPIP